MRPFRQIMVSLLLAALALSSTQASVVVQGTRFVFPSKEREITVSMSNKGKQPVLMQTWVDRGDAASEPQSADGPFLLTPPIFRLNPDKGQSVRVVFAGDESLPKDRESVFWLNTLEIPAIPRDAAKSNYMQLAIKSRFKLFYRPVGLPSDPDAAPATVTWQVLPGPKGGHVLRGQNPGAYFTSYAKLSLVVDGKSYDAASGMIGPFDQHDFALDNFDGAAVAGAHVRYVPMTDFGVGQEADSPVL